jgi:L-gulono-1,4-lactone dehydrogenase
MNRFRNWAGSVDAPARIERPATLEALLAAVRREGPIRPLGGGHAYAPLVPGPGRILDCSALNRCLAVDVDGPVPSITVEAGMRLRALSDCCESWGLSLPGPTVFGDITVGGALATASHGTGLSTATLSDRVLQLQIVNARGELQRIEADDPDLPGYSAGLGLLGVVYAVTLRLEPRFAVSLRQTAMPADEAFARIPDLLHRHAYVETFWFPGQAKAWVLLGDPTPVSGKDHWRDRLQQALRNRLTLGAGARLLPVLTRHLPQMSPVVTTLGHHIAFRESLRVVSAPEAFHYHTAFPRVLDHSLAIPLADAPEAWRTLKRLLDAEARAGRHPVNFVAHARYIGPSGVWLAPNYRQASCALEIVSGVGTQGAEDFCARFERTMFDAFPGTRPHLGKWIAHPREAALRLDQEALRRFLDLRQRVDPEGRFLNDFLACELLPIAKPTPATATAAPDTPRTQRSAARNRGKRAA